MHDWAGLIGVLAATFVGPALLARFVVGGTWGQVGIAYAAWLALLFVACGGGTVDERFGWMMILAMFLSIMAVPALTLAQRLGWWAIARA